MRKKWITVLATLFTCATLALGFSACETDGNTSAGSSNINSEQEQPPAHEHEYTTEITAPTCTEQGYTTYTCECGHSYVDTYVDALNHDFKNYISDNNATYTSDGTKTATCNREGCEEKDTVTDEGTKLASGISFRTLSVNGTNVYGKVSNTTATFSFISEISVVGTAKFVVSLDILGVQQVATKTIPLEIGDNTVYITETVDSEPVNVYTVTLRRRPMYEVTFNANGGTAVEKQTVEEDFCATEPTTTRAGYTFTAWDYDFRDPITKNTAVTASWTANTNTPYKVEYYLQNLEDDNYTLKEMANKTGTTDTTVNAEIKTFTHFTHKASSTDSGNIDGDGSTVLKVYYTRDRYTVTFKGNGGMLVSGKGAQTVKYGGSVTAPTYKRTGYTLTGFDKTNYTNISESFTVTAQWKINQYTLTIVYNNGQADKIIKQDYNTAIEAIEDPERAGYGFAWDKAIPTAMPAENMTVTAIWNEIYTVSGCSITGLTAYGKENYTTLNIPSAIDGVQITSIDSFAFYNCSSLTSIEIPDSVTSIGNAAFRNCSSLTEITLPFVGASKSATGYQSVFGYIFGYTTKSSFSSIGGATYQYYDSLYYHYYIPTSLKKVAITSGSIGNVAFSNCSGLTSIEIPDSVTSIGGSAFYNCSSLTSIEIPDSVTSIGYSAFYNCSSLTSIEIPDSVTSIGYSAFYNCSSLTSIEIPDSVTSIGDDAFYNCSSLTSVYITDIVAWCNISFGGFDSNPLSYAKNLHLNNELVTELVIPDGVTSIDSFAFSNCDNLTSVVIPDSVTSIGYSAFHGCRSLTEITLPFVGANRSATSASESTLFGYIFGKSSYTGGKEQSQYYSSGSSNVNYYIPISLKKVTVTGGKILYGAFSYCDMTNVVIGDSVTSIGEDAFSGCDSLTNVVIGDSVTSIGSGAFECCSRLTSIEIPDSVTSIGYEAFYNCSGLTSIEIPDSVTSIGGSAFKYCSSLTSVVIGDSVTSIGGSAFYNCSRLTSVYYEGTVSEWSAISIGSYNTPLTNATCYYYVENEADVPTDGGNYWHYNENGEIVVW